MKTISAKILCNEIDMPTIIVNSSFDGQILDFIQSLEFECIILIDEAEKTFTKDDDEILLKLIDGVYNKSRKLYILTTNRLTVNENLIGRPGRVRYVQEFGNLSPKVVEEYIDDNLKDKSKKDQILAEVDLLEISTIDILKALVEEVNIIGNLEEGNPMNVPKARHIFDVLQFNGCGEESIPLIKEIIKNNKPNDMSYLEWLNSKMPLAVEEAVEKRPAPTNIVAEDAPVSNKKTTEEREEEESVYNRLEYVIPGCSYTYLTRMTSISSLLWKDSETSLGTIVREPDLDGFFIISNRYDECDTLCLLVRRRGNPSLYRGSLLI